MPAESGPRVLIVAPAPPPYGGMALQAATLARLLTADGCTATVFATNFPLTGRWSFAHNVRGLSTLLRGILFCFRLRRALRGIDVLHIYAASWFYFFAVVAPAVVLGRTSGCRVVLNYRGGEAEKFFRQWGWMAAPFLRLASLLTAPSGFIADVIGRRFALPVAIVPNFLDLSAFRFRPRDPFHPHLLVTRHLEPMYDIESVVRAYGSIEQRYPGASLWIAGGGSDEAKLRRLAAELQLHGVRFLGAVPHAELPALYDQCDVYLNASRVDNFPGALLEASASGLAIVSTNPGGIPYIYTDDESALLAEPGDWQALAQAVSRVLESPALARRLTACAAAKVRECAWSEVRRALYHAYGVAVPQGPHAVAERELEEA